MTASRPVHAGKTLGAATLDGFLFGLLGMGGASCAGGPASPTRGAMMLSRALGLVVVLAAWILRTKVIALEVLATHLDVALTLLAGSLPGAWCAGQKARDNAWLYLDRIILVILPAFAFAMLAQVVLGDRNGAPLFAAATTDALAGVLAGFCIGFAMTATGVAASVLVAPALVVLFGIDSKLAGSLALMVTLPTLLVSLRQFSGVLLIPFICQERRRLLAVSAGALIGAALGVLLLDVMTSRLMLVAMLIVIFYAALVQLGAFFKTTSRVES